MDLNVKKSKTIYCHFSFRRPNKGLDGYGYFAVAMYADFNGKIEIDHRVTKRKLWQNQQFVSAIQSYENALDYISSYQTSFINHNIGSVMLVTDDSALAGWLGDPTKNKKYIPWMTKASEKYKCGGVREIMVNVGLCNVRDYEKSYKYCCETYLKKEDNVVDTTESSVNESGQYIVEIDNNIPHKTALDLLREDVNTPEVDGITEK